MSITENGVIVERDGRTRALRVGRLAKFVDLLAQAIDRFDEKSAARHVAVSQNLDDLRANELARVTAEVEGLTLAIREQNRVADEQFTKLLLSQEMVNKKLREVSEVVSPVHGRDVDRLGRSGPVSGRVSSNELRDYLLKDPGISCERLARLFDVHENTVKNSQAWKLRERVGRDEVSCSVVREGV